MGNLLFIIYAAYIFAYAIGIAGIGERATAWLVGLQLGRIEFFAALFVLYTVLGCLVESIGMIVITVPVLHPVLLSYGLDPVWFGVLLVILFKRDIAQGAALAAFMFLLYIPLGYATDTMIYRFRQRKQGTG